MPVLQVCQDPRHRDRLAPPTNRHANTADKSKPALRADVRSERYPASRRSPRGAGQARPGKCPRSRYKHIGPVIGNYIEIHSVPAETRGASARGMPACARRGGRRGVLFRGHRLGTVQHNTARQPKASLLMSPPLQEVFLPLI